MSKTEFSDDHTQPLTFVLRAQGLVVRRLARVRFGPYALQYDAVPPGAIAEVPVAKKLAALANVLLDDDVGDGVDDH
jgi:hypothetical protein